MVNLIFDLIDSKIDQVESWIIACRGTKLEYAIPKYKKQIEYYKSCKELLIENGYDDIFDYDDDFYY